MKRNKLKIILLTMYSENGVKSIMSGRMKPSYESMCVLYEKHKIPFTAWKDIKSYISNSNNTPIKDKITRAQGEN